MVSDQCLAGLARTPGSSMSLRASLLPLPAGIEAHGEVKKPLKVRGSWNAPGSGRHAGRGCCRMSSPSGEIPFPGFPFLPGGALQVAQHTLPSQPPFFCLRGCVWPWTPCSQPKQTLESWAGLGAGSPASVPTLCPGPVLSTRLDWWSRSLQGSFWPSRRSYSPSADDRTRHRPLNLFTDCKVKVLEDSGRGRSMSSDTGAGVAFSFPGAAAGCLSPRAALHSHGASLSPFPRVFSVWLRISIGSCECYHGNWCFK